jgi:fatty acid desaturase
VVSDYAELKRRVRAAGLLEPEPCWYVTSLAVNGVLLTLALLCLVRFHEPWVQALDAVALGLISGQIGFQFHDAGHHQMFPKAWQNRLVGLVCANALLGVSFGWWVDEHTRHHANPNHLDMDPDIENVALVYSTEQALGRSGPLRWIAKHQAFLFPPLAAFGAWSMHAQAVGFLVSRRHPGRRVEIAILLAHAVLYAGFMVAVAGPWAALMIVLIEKAVTGLYVVSAVTPNHQGMPQTDGGDDLDFLRRQVLTARNVRSGRLTDLWYGSLNLQIEHHLFPRMTRRNLTRARPIVRQFCEEIGVPYHEVSMGRAYVELLRFLHDVGAPLRGRATPSPGVASDGA